MSKKKTPKPEPEGLNIVEAMTALPNMDLLRIALTGSAVHHDRALAANLEEEKTDDGNDSKNVELVVEPAK